METKANFVSRLVMFLKANGQNIINGTSKLSLTTSALSLVNNVFNDLEAHGRGEAGSLPEDYLSEKFLKDSQFLFEFIKVTKSLKLIQGVQTLRGDIDISHFKGLTALELKKISAHLIVGLEGLPNLKSLTCNRSLASLEELLRIHSEQRLEDSWFKIKELNVSCNHLESLGLDSLRAVKNVEILDASQNNLKYLYELVAPEKLVVLKLSYNMLAYVPLLHPSSSFSLKVLLMRNNNVENLGGLELLINLEEFDISYNCVSEHNALKPMKSLKSLKLLNLENNPLTQSKQYFENLVTYFHMDVVSRGIILDGKKLTPEDIQEHTSQKTVEDYECRQQTSIIAIMEDKENCGATSYESYRQFKQATKPAREVERHDQRCEKDDRSLHSGQSDSTEVAGTQSKKNGAKKIRKKIREAVILQPGRTSDENTPSSAEVKGHQEELKIPSHIVTKRLIETRRKEFGEEWLIPSSSFQNLVIDDNDNAQQASSLTSNVSDTSYSKHNINRPLESCDEPESEGSKSEDSSSKSDSMKPQVGDLDTIPSTDSSMLKLSIRKQSNVSDDIQVLESSSYDQAYSSLVIDVDNTADLPMYMKQEKKEDLSDDDDEEDIEDDVVSDSEEESEDRIFILERKDETRCYPLFVCIGKKFLKEKVFKTGRLYDVLDLRNLLSVRITEAVDGSEKCEIILTFETIQASKQRTYICDEVQYAKDMASILQPFADAKAFEDATVGALQCLKCRSEFSRQVAHLKIQKKKMLSGCDAPTEDIEETDACPNCGSNLVVELDSMPLPSMLPASVRRHKAKAPQASTSPSLGQMSSMLYSMIKYTKAKRKSSVPYTSTPKMSRSTKLDETDVTAVSHYHTGLEDTEYETAIVYSGGRDEKILIEASESKDLSQLSRNSSNATIPSQSSIAVISSDSEGDLSLDIFDEKETVCSPAAISPSVDLKKSLSLSDVDILPSSIPGTPSGNTSDDIFHECKDTLPSTGNFSHVIDDSSTMLSMFSETSGSQSFSSPDHRLKLYLEFSILKKDEEFDACIETYIMCPSSLSEFQGLLVLSSKRIYVLKKIKEYGDDLSESVQKLYSCPIMDLRIIRVLPGRQGLAILLGAEKVFYLLIQDSVCCDSFMSCMKETLARRLRSGSFPSFENLEAVGSVQMQDLISKFASPFTTAKEELEITLHLSVLWCDEAKGEDALKRVALIITPGFFFYLSSFVLSIFL